MVRFTVFLALAGSMFQRSANSAEPTILRRVDTMSPLLFSASPKKSGSPGPEEAAVLDSATTRSQSADEMFTCDLKTSQNFPSAMTSAAFAHEDVVMVLIRIVVAVI